MDGFQPHSEASSLYSCWPVFVMPYNLPPNKCLKQGFIFLVLVILGPKEPRKQMNVFMHMLFEGMKELWKGTCVGATSAHYVTDKEWNYSILYLYTSLVEVESYF
jgi:hypothetical protein